VGMEYHCCPHQMAPIYQCAFLTHESPWNNLHKSLPGSRLLFPEKTPIKIRLRCLGLKHIEMIIFYTYVPKPPGFFKYSRVRNRRRAGNKGMACKMWPKK
jgi:hypothetical protein